MEPDLLQGFVSQANRVHEHLTNYRESVGIDNPKALTSLRMGLRAAQTLLNDATYLESLDADLQNLTRREGSAGSRLLTKTVVEAGLAAEKRLLIDVGLNLDLAQALIDRCRQFYGRARDLDLTVTTPREALTQTRADLVRALKHLAEGGIDDQNARLCNDALESTLLFTASVIGVEACVGIGVGIGLASAVPGPILLLTTGVMTLAAGALITECLTQLLTISRTHDQIKQLRQETTKLHSHTPWAFSEHGRFPDHSDGPQPIPLTEREQPVKAQTQQNYPSMSPLR